MFRGLRADLNIIKEKDPAFPGKLQAFFIYQGLHALIFYRISHFLYKHHLKFLGRWLAFVGRFFTNIEIHPAAEIAHGVFIDHGAGLVIGETAIVGEGCVFFHGATLGGTGHETGKRHPTIGKNVMVGSGSKILGNITVGDNTLVAANAVVLKNIPANCTVVGVPGKIVRKDGQRVMENCNQAQTLEALQLEMYALQERMRRMEQAMEELQSVQTYPERYL